MAQTLEINKPTVIEEVPFWIKVYSDQTVDRSWTGPPEFKFMSDPVQPHHHFIDGVAVKDVETSDDLKLRIYLPEKVNGGEIPKMPLLLHFHGGGFCISEADWFMYYAVYSRLARELTAVVVSVYLRRAPENRLPASCEDAVAALRWLGSGAGGEEWLGGDRVDLSRVFLIGDSSGANIVHYVAAAASGEDAGGFGSVRVAGSIPIHPGFVRKERSRSEMEMPETPFLTLAMVDKFLSLALPLGATKDHPITCPMGEAAPPLEGLKLPAYLYCAADQDLLLDTQMEFYEAMKKANKDVELFTSEGVGHSFYLNKVAVDMDPTTSNQTVKLFKRIKEFIDEH